MSSKRPPDLDLVPQVRDIIGKAIPNLPLADRFVSILDLEEERVCVRGECVAGANDGECHREASTCRRPFHSER
jgi:hypothetical protein